MTPTTWTYTLDMVSRLLEDLPPLVPEALATATVQAKEQLSRNPSLTPGEIEDALVSFGRQLWPYREAFQECVELYEGTLGEKFLLGKLTPTLKQRYKVFKEFGGTFRDLHSGAPARFFHDEERGTLCAALIDVHRDIRQYARQAVLSTGRLRYEDRIVEFQVLLDDIEKRLDTLRIMADGEQEHPELASEIRAQVRSFEEGLCLLGPKTDYLAVCQSVDHFHGRKLEKKMHLK